MFPKEFSAGKKGDNIRSDCWVKMKIGERAGRKITLESKVAPIYGQSIEKLIDNILDFFNISDCEMEINDQSAFPFVIIARIEAVIKGLGMDKGKKYLPEFYGEINDPVRDRQRRSRLYLPGDQPKLFINAGVHGPDGIILDLEDSVAPDSKDSARLIVRNALRAVDFFKSERMVRINQLPLGLKDLEEIVPEKVDLILLPKIESADQIKSVRDKINSIRESENIERDIFLMPIIESALGILNAFEIASSDKDIVAIAIGLEDYTADIGTKRTDEGRESFFARSMIVNAAKAAGIQAIDTVYSDVSNSEGLMESVKEAKSLGFNGKGCIHPRQIRIVHDGFSPGKDEIEKARKIVLAFEKAEKEGLGVVSLGSKMIDPPVVKRALQTIEQALNDSLIKKNWREDNE
ncbi:MAG: aldolase/citrate lyase family protein [Acidobacteriota bacterium]